MRKIPYILAYLLCLSTIAIGQNVPDGIPYQTYIRGIDGLPVTEKLSDLTIELYTNYATGDSKLVYKEKHEALTIDKGYLSIIIGRGHPVEGNFENTPWSHGNVWIKITLSIDDPGAEDIISVSPFMTVPYAFHAESTSRVSEPQHSQNGDPSRLSYLTHWRTQGNINMDPNLFFLGNIDPNDFVFKTGALERMRIMSGGNISIVQSLWVEKNLTNLGNLTINGNGILSDSISVQGNANFESDVTIGGLKSKSDFVLSFDTTGHLALFNNLNTGNGDALQIKINVEKNYSGNKYMKFFNGTDRMTGSVEGFDIDRDVVDIPEPSTEAIAEAFCAALTGENPLYSALIPFSTDLNSFGDLWDLSGIPGVPLPDIPEIQIDGFTLLQGFCAIPNPSPFGPDCLLSIPTIGFPETDILAPLAIPDVPSFDFETVIGSFPNIPSISNAVCPSGHLNAYLDTMKYWVVENDADGFLTTDPGDLILAAVLWQLQREANDGGVSYASSGADYAEWLEKSDPGKLYMFGQIVGVREGKISLNTTGAEQIMSISRNPVVVGNAPEEQNRDKYARVAFMGQAPVFVKGGCRSGDFIVPSGHNDGIALAVAPEEIELKHLNQIAGRALEDSENKRLDMIMMMVGVKTNEWQMLFRQQEKRIQSLEHKYGRIKKIVRELEKIKKQKIEPGIDPEDQILTEVE